MAKDSSKLWTVFSLVSALGAASVTKKLMDSGWKAATGKTPPANPADPDVDLREAIAWAAVSGTTVALAKMLATRRAANYYARSVGHLPPGLGPDAPRTAKEKAAESQAVVEAAATGGTSKKAARKARR